MNSRMTRRFRELLSARIGMGYRALCVLEVDDTADTWNAARGTGSVSMLLHRAFKRVLRYPTVFDGLDGPSGPSRPWVLCQGVQTPHTHVLKGDAPMSTVSHVPVGYHSVTPMLCVEGADGLLEFLTQAFDATDSQVHRLPNGRVMHGAIRVGNSMLMVSDVCEGMSATSSGHYLYFDNADRYYEQALAAGAEGVMPVSDMFWGDRVGCVRDRWGNNWWIGTHIEDIDDEELARRVAEHSPPGSP